MVPATAWTALASFNSYLAHTSRINHPEITCNILDPVSTIIRLGLLVFYPRGTKITIYQNTLQYDEPGIFQGPIRWSKGNARTELHNLCTPITRFVNKYKYYKLRKYAIRGLQRLQQAYKNDTSVTTYSIELYCKTLNDNDNNDNNANNDNNDNNKETKVEEKKEKKTKGKTTREKDEINFSTFDNLWSDEEINIILNLMNQLSQSRLDKTVSNLDMISKTNKTKYYLKAIHNILKAKDENVQYRIKNAANQI